MAQAVKDAKEESDTTLAEDLKNIKLSDIKKESDEWQKKSDKVNWGNLSIKESQIESDKLGHNSTHSLFLVIFIVGTILFAMFGG